MERRFIDNGDGTVTDTCTGLMWQRDTGDVNGDGDITQWDRLRWQYALKYCEDLEFAGYSDWRLPNIREFLSIVDHGRLDPAIAPPFSAVSWFYWSSSSGPRHARYAWFVHFQAAVAVADGPKDFYYYARAVRGGPR